MSHRSTPKKSGQKKFDFASRRDGGAVPELNLDKASLSDSGDQLPSPEKISSSAGEIRG